MRMEETIFT